MKIFGNWLYKVNTEEGKEQFKRYYKIDPFEYIIRHKITVNTLIKHNEKSCLVILDNYNKAVQLFLLEEHEYFNIYTNNKPTNDRLVESSKMAFIWATTNIDMQPVYALEGTSYEMNDSDWDSKNQKQAVIQTVQNVLKKYEIDLLDLENKILFIKQVS